MGEALDLCDNFKVNKIIINKYDNNEENLCKTNKCIKLKEGDVISVKNKKLFILNPSKNNNDKNENSLIIFTKINKKNILLMGDATINNENRIINEYSFDKIDILKVGHHGSNTGTSLKFLKNIKPKNAIISVAENNRYNHPSKEVIDRLDKYNINTYLTSKNGMIKIKLYEKQLKIITALSYN